MIIHTNNIILTNKSQEAQCQDYLYPGFKCLRYSHENKMTGLLSKPVISSCCYVCIPNASDCARYQVLGNRVAIPCVDYVLQGIALVLRAGSRQKSSPKTFLT